MPFRSWLDEAVRLRRERVHEGTSWDAAEAENARLEELEDCPASELRTSPTKSGAVAGSVTPEEPGAGQ